ncbi:MAG TPA: sigma-70 family RNA polymerase sigma factor [Candidatus Polarisedimenticolaceae bacterium]|nr:sigma-70 family RNA polymerase sigma factor [Candidatus Polarisedimenticolaceae bacterium]
MTGASPMRAASRSEAFLANLRANDPTAIATLVRSESPRLLSVARRILRNEEDAKDAVQEGLIAALGSLDRFEGGSQLSTWLHRIVVNAALMKIRAKRSRPEESIDDLLPGFEADGHISVPASEWAPADALVMRDEVCQLVRASIDRLPESYRTVLLLRDIEELSTEETAQALGITSTAVKVRLHRARQALRTLLDPRLRS